MTNNKHGDPTVEYTFNTTACTSASTVVLAANTDRRYAKIINHATTGVWVLIGSTTQAAVVNQGIPLAASGGTYTMSPADGNLSTQTVHAIGNSTGTKALVTLSCS